MARPPLLYNWKRSHTRHAHPYWASVLSIALHTALIVGAVRATESASDALADERLIQPYMLKLMNRAPKDAVPEVTRFLDISYSLAGARNALSKVPSVVPDAAGDNGRDKSRSVQLHLDAMPTDDSVFTMYDVDSIAEALFANAGPVYPSEMVRRRMNGLVVAQYVVDTTGWADTLSLNILQSTDPLFTNAVRAALANMRFKPARIRRTPVRQLVQQSFIFRISSDTTS